MQLLQVSQAGQRSGASIVQMDLGIGMRPTYIGKETTLQKAFW